jgi:outer membrane protein, heavy metal efflux system
MKTFFFRLAPVFFFVIAANAQDTLTLRDAVQFALRNSPELRVAEQRVGVSAGLLQQSGLWKNPRFFFQTENLQTSDFNFADDSDTYALLTQPVELPGKRSSRIAVAQSAYRRAQLQRDLARREIAYRVKKAYWRVAAADRAQQLLSENLDGMQAMVTYHVARVREGAMAEADLLRVQLERERLEIDSTAATLEAERARIDLYREMGRSDYGPVRLTDELETAEPPDIEVRVEAALGHRQEVLEARAALDQAMAVGRLERASARPDLDFIGGYKRSTGLNTAVLGLSLNIPLFDRNQGNIKASSSAVREAEALVASTEAAVRAEVLAAKADYSARRRQVTSTLRLIRDHAMETSRIAHAAYQEGGIDLLRLIDAERIRIESELLYYRALAEYQQSVANLENVMGVSQ